MCGIVGAVAQRDVAPILLEGLKRLEYRGYDSAGIAVIDQQRQLQRRRVVGKVYDLRASLKTNPLLGSVGIAHTRWATHGKPTEDNAHPHVSDARIAVVHNGIIENHETLRDSLIQKGYHFISETDSEVVVHLVHSYLAKAKNLLHAIRHAVAELQGAFSLAFISTTEVGRLIAVRSGNPLVVGMGIGENFIASDTLALLPVARQFIYLEEGDIADIDRENIAIYDRQGILTERKVHVAEAGTDIADRGGYRHYMLKEIFEQPQAITSTLQGRLGKQEISAEIFGEGAPQLFERVQRVQIVACGTSYHAGLIARHWLESLAGIPCQVEIASEIRYRTKVIEPGTLFVALSQSGETADTLAAVKTAGSDGCYLGTLAICNVLESSLVRESDFTLRTMAGPEIGVASTKAFTTQLVALFMLTMVLGRRYHLSAEHAQKLLKQLQQLPRKLEEALQLNNCIKEIAKRFIHKEHALFLGRGIHYPVALEGALKLKELSYIHAEAYPAGELKHGPLALVDEQMSVIALVPHDELLEKLKSNLQEVKARGGELLLFTDQAAKIEDSVGVTTIVMPPIDSVIAPILYTIPLQLLAYHVAVLKGTDVDQPRNLAKSVTVE